MLQDKAKHNHEVLLVILQKYKYHISEQGVNSVKDLYLHIHTFVKLVRNTDHATTQWLTQLNQSSWLPQ